jgi:hypothetical protein
MTTSTGWKTIKTETVNGRLCELKYGEWGKGRAKARKWEMFIDGEQVSYASIKPDVDPNWRYALTRAAATVTSR